ncbi:hypothetical protein ONK27_29145, partial [Salmonella enterica subsp. enterica serovar Virginia]|nr:hypothetical protein [Salmonella enterica subsp. enterica serovar Virginia]
WRLNEVIPQLFKVNDLNYVKRKLPVPDRLDSLGYISQIKLAMGDFSIVRVTRPLHQAVQGWLTNLEEEDVNQWRAFETEVNA